MTITNFIQLSGGIGIFLFGMKIMGEGLENAAGDKLKQLIDVITGNRFFAILVGVVFTAIIQSSSATTSMVVGFVNSGLMNLSQAVGVIMGADIGTTVTSLIISLNVAGIAPLAVFIGVLFLFFAKKQTVKYIGEIMTGFGLLFMGITTMSSSMAPLRDSEVFHRFITDNSNPFAGVLIGLVITAVIQSSSASVGILQALAMQGLVPFHFAAYVVLGQNLGGVVPTLISSVGTKTNARRAAIFRLVFNFLGAAVFFVIMYFTPYLDLLEKVTDDPVFQVSLAHIVFNVGSVIFAIPFSNLMIRMTERLVKDRPGEDEGEFELHFIDERILRTAPMAVTQVGKETVRMAEKAKKNFYDAAMALINSDVSGAEKILKTEEEINFLNKQITDFLIKVNILDISDKDSYYTGKLFHTVNDIERIGDHAINLLEAAQKADSDKIKLPDMVREDISRILKIVMKLLDSAVEALENGSVTKDEFIALADIEQQIDDLTGSYNKKHIERLNAKVYSVETGMLFINTIVDFERVGDHAINIGGSLLDGSAII